MNENLNKIKEKIDKKLEELSKQEITTQNIDNLYKLVDIHKDIANEEYWKEDIMRYRNYNAGGNYDNEYGDEYGRRGVSGTGRRYRGNYGARGVDAKYRGEEIMDDMYGAYQEYNDSKEMYGADKETMESFKYMIKSFKDYYKHLKENASSQEEIQILKQAIDEMARM